MTALAAPVAALSWLGQQGTRAVAALVFIGIALPSIGALFKPFVAEAIFVLLCIAFLRIDPVAFRGYLGRPALVLTATAWTSVVIPAMFGVGCLAFNLKDYSPDLFLALILQSVASPMMASPALAALMGLDATLVLVTLITSTALIPFTTPLFVYVFVGEGLPIAPAVLGLKLFAILAGSACAGVGVRRVVGSAAIERHKDAINGFNVIILFVFVAAVMQSVGSRFLAAPMITIGLAVFAFAVFFAVLGLTGLLFMRAGGERAMALAFMASQRNMGLMLAAAGGALPDLAWLYFALSQFPIYLSPFLLQRMLNHYLTTGRRLEIQSPSVSRVSRRP